MNKRFMTLIWHVAPACLLWISGVVVSWQDYGQDATPPRHAVFGDPRRQEAVVRREACDVFYDNVRKVPLWVQYRVTAEDVEPKVDRPPRFYPDRLLPVSWRVQPSDYDGTGMDRGHQAPEADMRRNADVAAEAMLMSNIAPQRPEFNRNGWRKLEAAVREKIRWSDEAIIVTGPVFQHDHCTIGPAEVVVPGGFFKVVALKKGEQWTVEGYEAPQSASDWEPERMKQDVRAISRQTGFEFFPNIKR